MADIQKYSEQTFESIKHINEYGQEFWYARELQTALEYTEWRNFKKIIDKAKDALVGQHPGVLLLMVGRHVGGGHQNSGLGDGGELRDGGGAGTAQDQIAGRHDQGHVIDILPDLDAVVPQL